MSNFKPQVTIITKQTIQEHMDSYGKKTRYRIIQYPTYVELKRNLKQHLEENFEVEVSVSRSRRGNWGEWFENWKLINGKPEIVKQGWM
jgi:hypothetical protein